MLLVFLEVLLALLVVLLVSLILLRISVLDIAWSECIVSIAGIECRPIVYNAGDGFIDSIAEIAENGCIAGIAENGCIVCIAEISSDSSMQF